MKSSPHQRPKGCTTRKNKGHLRQHAPSWKTMWGSSAHVPFRCCLSTEFIMLKRRWLTTPGMGQLWQKQVTGVFISRVQRNYPGPRKNNTTYTAERMHKIRITQPNVTLLPWIKGYLKAASNTKRMNCREASPSLSSVDVVLEATKRWERINCLSFLFSPHTRIRILVNTLMAREQRIFHVEALRTRDHGTYWLIDWLRQTNLSSPPRSLGLYFRSFSFHNLLTRVLCIVGREQEKKKSSLYRR